MASHALKQQPDMKPSSQYSRLQKLLNFRFFDKKTENHSREIQDENDDFIDIVLEADFSHKGKVTRIR